ncbi:hypothetical protein GCM10027445_23530 [Amycolatopsis endophytica]|uniref:DUF3558 domain-containing protein n=1 Tax=Amycolatopsis endophytica TaxID=860233 RepID=A0A853BGE9_9PSEU|nr:DUF3558 domain-containing protein [Amycolatopsis endophytica]NYI93617.1 hypothetical protein [Amycolatopsis endophytica]
MTLNVRIVRILTGAACLALITAACTTTVAGAPSPASTSSAVNTDVFAGLNACDVLNQLAAGQGFNPGENKSRRNECGATKPGSAAWGLALDPVQGLSEFAEANAEVVDAVVNGRKALQAAVPTGGCAIAIEVTEHARAMVQVALISGPDDPQACVDAQALAEKLEPLLPR